MKTKNIFKLALAILICESAGIIGAFFTGPAVSSTWYASLSKPDFQPPAWLFSPVWITLYFLMGVSLYLAWSSYAKALEGQAKKIWKWGMFFFFLQLAFNAFWSIIFFGLKSTAVAFFEIIFLWLLILITILFFYKISKPAAWLLVPYILWVSFAGYLNYSIWQLNKNPVVVVEESSWEKIVQAINDCEVETVFQAHSLDVSATLKNGTRLEAVEPKIDEIIDLAVQAEPKCGRIQMATE